MSSCISARPHSHHLFWLLAKPFTRGEIFSSHWLFSHFLARSTSQLVNALVPRLPTAQHLLQHANPAARTICSSEQHPTSESTAWRDAPIHATLPTKLLLPVFSSSWHLSYHQHSPSSTRLFHSGDPSYHRHQQTPHGATLAVDRLPQYQKPGIRPHPRAKQQHQHHQLQLHRPWNKHHRHHQALQRRLAKVAAALSNYAAALRLPEHHPLQQASLLLQVVDEQQQQQQQQEELVTPNSSTAAAVDCSTWHLHHPLSQLRAQAQQAVHQLLVLLQQAHTLPSAADEAALAAWAAANIRKSLLDCCGGSQAAANSSGWQQSVLQEDKEEHLQQEQQQEQALLSHVDDAIEQLILRLAPASSSSSSLPACSTLLQALLLSPAAQQRTATLQAAADLAACHVHNLKQQLPPPPPQPTQRPNLPISAAVSLLQALVALPLPKSKQQQLVSAAAARLLPHIPAMCPALRADLLHACAKAATRLPQLVKAIAASWTAAPPPTTPSISSIAAAGPQQAAAWLAWCVTCCPPPAAAPAAACVAQQLSGLPAGHLARLAWASTMTRSGTPELYTAIAEEAWKTLCSPAKHASSRFQPAELCDLLWALAMARHPARPLCGKAARYIARRVARYQAGHLALALWAFARLGCPDQVFTEVALHSIVEAAAQQEQQLLQAWQQQQRGRARPAVPVLAEADDPYAPLDDTSSSTSSSRHPLSGEDVPGPPNGSSSLPMSRQQLLLPGWQLVYCLQGLALQRHYDEAALEQLVQLLPLVAPSSYPHVAWALASLNFQGPSAPRVFSWLAYRAIEGLGAGSIQRRHLGLLAWSFAAAGLQQPALWEALSQALQLPAPVLTASLDRSALTQLYQAHLAQGSALAQLLLPPASLQAAKAAYLSWAQGSSYMERAVLACVQSLGYRCSGQHRDEVTGLVVDIAVWVGRERLAVEVDGPQHFCSNQVLRPLGGTVLRDRILVQAGWRVLSVPLRSWQAMQGRRAGQMQRDFMSRHIAAALAA